MLKVSLKKIIYLIFFIIISLFLLQYSLNIISKSATYPIRNYIILGTLPLFIIFIFIAKNPEKLIPKLAILFIPVLNWGIHRFAIDLSILEVIIIIWLLLIKTSRKPKKQFIYKKPFLLYFFSLMISTIFSFYPIFSIGFSLKLIFYGILIWLFVQSIDSFDDLIILVKLFLLLAIFSGIVSVFQATWALDSVKLNFETYNPNVGVAIDFAKRYPAIFTDAQIAGLFFGVIVVLSLCFRQYLPSPLFYPAIIFSIIGLVLSNGRAAFLGTGAGILYLILLTKNMRVYAKVFSIFLIIIISLLSFKFYSQLNFQVINSRMTFSTFETQFINRFKLYEQGINLFKKSWIIGVGPSGMNIYSAFTYRSPMEMYNFDYIMGPEVYAGFESSYINFLCYQGILWFVIFSFLIFTYIKTHFNLLNSNFNKKLYDISTAGFACIIVMIIGFSSSAIYCESRFMVLFSFILSLLNVAVNLGKLDSCKNIGE